MQLPSAWLKNGQPKLPSSLPQDQEHMPKWPLHQHTSGTAMMHHKLPKLNSLEDEVKTQKYVEAEAISAEVEAIKGVGAIFTEEVEIMEATRIKTVDAPEQETHLKIGPDHNHQIVKMYVTAVAASTTKQTAKIAEPRQRNAGTVEKLATTSICAIPSQTLKASNQGSHML